jgi:hypothetical protein
MTRKEDLEEKFVSGDGVSSVEKPVTPEGGEVKKRRADLKKSVHPTSSKLKEGEGMDDEEDHEEEEEEEEDEDDLSEAFANLFEGENLTEDFKNRASVIFGAAVNEAVSKKVSGLAEELQEDFEARLTESVDGAINGIVENLDSYLDYAVKEFMEENKIAIESGIKVEMAESLLSGLKGMFYEHNIKIDEETVDVVAELEEQVQEASQKMNSLAKKNMSLVEEVNTLKAEKAFLEVCEGLTTTQAERLRVLSERISFESEEAYKGDLETLKESFFKKSSKVLSESIEEEQEIITEDTSKNKRVSEYDSVNSIVAAINARNLR